MRARTKVTAGGAALLSCAAIAGGMLVTSQAMAEDITPTTRGTLTIVSATAGADEAVTCTYEDVELPAPPAAPGDAHGPTLVTSGGEQSDDPGPVFSTSGEVGAGGGVVVSGHAVVEAAGGADAEVGAVSVEGGGVPAPDGAPTIQFDGVNGARKGTAEECAALFETMPTP